MAVEPLVGLSDVRFGYGNNQVLDSVSFEVGREEIVVIVGPSGCGKSTTLNLVAGLLPCQNGKIEVGGRPPGNPDIVLGYMFQDLRLLPWKSVIDNVAFGLAARRVSENERLSVAKRYIDLLGLTGFEKHYPNRLSGGMQQRVCIGRAFAMNPDLLLMDEPFKSVDAQLRLYLLELFSNIWQRSPKGVIFVTHDTQEAVLLGDRIIVYTKRPVRVKATFEIDRPQSMRKATDPDLRDTEAQILALLYEERAALPNTLEDEDKEGVQIEQEIECHAVGNGLSTSLSV
ncbi:MAG: ABC transporter ATP-binding protein [Chloroflexi bacterium]|nr:ABC transporter ATP-binding protein [Chloroflexota bacterium]